VQQRERERRSANTGDWFRRETDRVSITKIVRKRTKDINHNKKT
jgi:hypothetical protein